MPNPLPAVCILAYQQCAYQIDISCHYTPAMPIPILHTKETEHFLYCYHPWPKYEEKGGFVWRLNGIDTKRVCSLPLPPCQFVLDDRPDLSPSPLFRWSMTPLPIPFIVPPLGIFTTAV